MDNDLRFSERFGRYVCVGDTITTEAEGFTVTATIHYDQDSGPPDEECDGFWPSLDPKDDGYIGPKSKSTLARHMAHARHVLESWKNDEWFYCGIVLSVSKNGIELDDHAAALWRIDANYPARGKRAQAKTNDYLSEVADEMLGEALEAGKAALAKLCDCDKAA